MAELDGRVAIVTGAARGIGAAIARAFDDRGASVVICDVAGNPEQVASGLRDSVGVVCDVSSEDDVDALIKRTLGEFGRLDIVVNNAGIDGAFNPLAESAPDTFDQVIAVNLRGVYLVMRKIYSCVDFQRRRFCHQHRVGSRGRRFRGNECLYRQQGRGRRFDAGRGTRVWEVPASV